MSTVAGPKNEGKKKGKCRKTLFGGLLLRLKNGDLQSGLVTAIVANDDDYSEWARYLSGRRRPPELERLFRRDATEPLLWCVPKAIRKGLPFREKKNRSSNPKNKQTNSRSAHVQRTATRADEWLECRERKPKDGTYALDALNWCRRLPGLAGKIPSSLWGRLLDELTCMARTYGVGQRFDNPWIAQLLTVELPLSLAYHFPELSCCRELGQLGIERLDVSLAELTDGAGMPLATDVTWMPLLAACWTRSFTMVNVTNGLKLSPQAHEDFRSFVRHVLRLLRSDGRMPFDPPIRDKVMKASVSAMIRAALIVTEDEKDKSLGKVVLKGKDVNDRRLPDSPGYHSEWSGIAVLQPEWDPKKPRLTVDFSSLDVRAELSCDSEVLFSTEWSPSIHVDGAPLRPAAGEWESVCWFSDFDVDFLELSLALTNGWNLQRQFLMGRQDLFLYVADNLIGPDVGEIDYRLTIACCDTVRLRPKAESREGKLRGRKHLLGLVLPIGLPEWRADHGQGEFHMRDGSLELRHRCRGKGLCAPLFLDLHPSRLKKPSTWRHLTVAEQLEIVPNDVAVGYRVHIGPEQWLIYRSLGARGNRTILGQNLTSEFMFARFLQDGDIDPLVEIE